MAILSIKSTNESFSHVIQKNPNSGMTAKNLRKGTLFGFYPKGTDKEYVAYFRDGLNSVSYGTSQFEYLDTTRYAAGFVFTNMISELLRSAFRKQSELDVSSAQQELSFVVRISRFDMLAKSFAEIKNVEFQYEEISKDIYKVKLLVNESLYYALNVLSLFALMVAITNDEEIYVDDSLAAKYAEIVAYLDVPYQLRYLFQLKVTANGKQFRKMRDTLQQSTRYNDLQLHNGSTADWRFDFVKNRIDLDTPIVEVGCGEGFYTTQLARKVDDTIPYIAIDVDEEVLGINKRRTEKRGIENVYYYDNLTTYLATNAPTEPVNVLLMEVIEHMPLENSKALIKEILKINVATAYISTPMKEFNKHYFGENTEAKRHDDHDWEATKEEFLAIIDECLEGTDYTYTYHLIGDIVDGAAPSQGVIIMPK